MRLIQELRERRFVPFFTAYLAGGWAVLEVVDQLVGNEVVPEVFYPVALTLLISGIPAVGIIAWFHGARGVQKPRLGESLLLLLIAVVGAASTTYVVQQHVDEGTSVLDRLDPTEDPRRVAVLYFDAVGGQGATEPLASGLTEALIDELTRVSALEVVSRNGVAPLRGRESFPSDSVAEALQVGTFVRGRVAESDSIIRVRVEVVRALSDRTVGSSTFERPRSELFELQDQMAEQVAVFLRETIGSEVELVAEERRTESVEAWLRVQEAAELETEAERLNAMGDGAGALRRVERADSLLAVAERLAPDWSTPVTRRGWLDYERARWGGFDRGAISEDLAKAVEHANAALELNPRDADALELRATVQYWRYLVNLTSEPGEAERLLEQAEADFHAATAANPSQASAYSSLSHLLMNQGRPAQAKLAAEKSYEEDPWLLSANLTLLRLFQASLDLQDAQEARKWCQAGTARFPDDYRFHECQVWLYSLPGQDPAVVAGDLDEMWAKCERVVELSPPAREQYNDSRCQMLAALALVRAGLADSARSVMRRARVGSDVDPVRDLAWLEAVGLTWLGDYEEAVDRLAVYLAANPGQADSFAEDESWWLEDLRSHPRFQRLVTSR